jgi:hypothetical protein
MISLILLACCIDSPAWQNPRAESPLYMESGLRVEIVDDGNTITIQVAPETPDDRPLCPYGGTMLPCLPTNPPQQGEDNGNQPQPNPIS